MQCSQFDVAVAAISVSFATLGDPSCLIFGQELRRRTRPVAAVVAHDKAGMRRGGSVLYVGLEFSRLQYALSVSGTAFCEDVGPFQSSKTKAAEAAFFLGADAPLTSHQQHLHIRPFTQCRGDHSRGDRNRRSSYVARSRTGKKQRSLIGAPAQQVGELNNVRGYPPCLILRQQLRR